MTLSNRQRSRPARAMRARICAAAVALALLVLRPPAAAAQCEGDCDGNGTVAINELVLAVRIALGDANVAECPAADYDNSGYVAINELVGAVSRALTGCQGELDEDALRASVRASVEPIIRIIDLGSASAGSGGAAGIVATAARARTAGFSGCEVFDCFLFGRYTGSEQVCCLGDQYSIDAESCIFNDDFGNVFTRTGSFLLRGDAIECTGALPVGSSFEVTFDSFLFVASDADGSFVTTAADLTETFTAAAGGCARSEPDQFGFGIRGDGTRFIEGAQRQIVGDGFGNLLSDTASAVDGLRIDVVSRRDASGCRVDAELEGELTSSDFTAGSEFSAGFSQLRVSQVPTRAAVALDINGTFSTDCIGDVTVETLEPLRLTQSSECFSGGRLRAELDDGAAIVGYTPSGGVELDFGGDGSIDERLASCEDVVSEQCVTHETQGLCMRCDAATPCPDDLQCYRCSSDCASAVVQRCSVQDELVTCEDGKY